ncbi:hypothetical protein FACS1894132_14430 [Clostridia bacterium]|nr:hypothetical protein FACS1894132_14430 [Clostridia bacterium]
MSKKVYIEAVICIGMLIMSVAIILEQTRNRFILVKRSGDNDNG